jgi:hypothetical protein
MALQSRAWRGPVACLSLGSTEVHWGCEVALARLKRDGPSGMRGLGLTYFTPS